MFCVCVCVSESMYVHHMSAGACRSQKRVSNEPTYVGSAIVASAFNS